VFGDNSIKRVFLGIAGMVGSVNGHAGVAESKSARTPEAAVSKGPDSSIPTDNGFFALGVAEILASLIRKVDWTGILEAADLYS
jgi:hypothetical protein